MCCSRRSAEQDVVAGDRVGRRDGPRAADRRDERLGHRCIFSGRGARGASWSRCASARRRASASRSARAGSVGRPDRSGARSGPDRRRRRRPDPAGLADERHPLALDRIEAHPQRGRLLLGDLADIGGLLVGRHRAAADDPLRLADHQPGEVVAVHAPPRRREQVVRALEPHLERRQRRVRLQALALVDEGAVRVDEVVALHGRSRRRRRPGSSPRDPPAPGASTARAVRRRSARPRSGSPAGPRRRTTTGTPRRRSRGRRA